MKLLSRKKRTSGALFLVALLLFSLFTALPAHADARPSDYDAASVLLYCFNTEQILHEKAADTPIAPAVTAKLMTALLILETYPDLSETLTITAEALGNGDYVDSLVGFTEGARLTVHDLLAFLLLGKSDFSQRAATLLVRLTEGDSAAFCEKMNARAASLGMRATVYQNPTGQDADGAVTTARDVFLLAKTLYEDSRFTDLVAHSSITLSTGYKLYNVNAFLSAFYHDESLLYANATGMIAGSSLAAGNVLVTTAEESNGYSYLCVVLGARTDFGGNNTAYPLAKAMFRWGRDGFSYQKVLSDAKTITTLPIEDGDGVHEVPLFPQKSLSLYLPKDIDITAITYEYTLTTNKLIAPCEKNQVVGELTLYLDGEILATCPLVTGTDVARASSADFEDALVRALTSVPAILVYFVLVFLVVRKILLACRRARHRKDEQEPENELL